VRHWNRFKREAGNGTLTFRSNYVIFMANAGQRVGQEQDNLGNLWDTSWNVSSGKPSTPHGIGRVDRGIGFASFTVHAVAKGNQ